MTIRIAGVDFPGDATLFYERVATWLARKRKAATVELDDLLSAIFVFSRERMCSYWTGDAPCEAYLARLAAAKQPAALAAKYWKAQRRKKIWSRIPIPGTRWNVTFGPPPWARPTPQLSHSLHGLLEEIRSYAAAKNLLYIKPELVLWMLGNNPAYGERERLLSSGISIDGLRHVVE